MHGKALPNSVGGETGNITLCFSQYINHFRGKKIRFFLCGDYEFLSEIEGISGASGRKMFYSMYWYVAYILIHRPPFLLVVFYDT